LIEPTRKEGEEEEEKRARKRRRRREEERFNFLRRRRMRVCVCSSLAPPPSSTLLIPSVTETSTIRLNNKILIPRCGCRQPAAMVLGARHEDHSYGENWGEPISDFLMGNWDAQSGRLANAHDTKPTEKDLPVKFPRYFPHTKGVWSGAKEAEEGGEDEDEDEDEEAED
jgi:hypothetical protein